MQSFPLETLRIFVAYPDFLAPLVHLAELTFKNRIQVRDPKEPTSLQNGAWGLGYLPGILGKT